MQQDLAKVYLTPFQKRLIQILETDGPQTRAQLVKKVNRARTTIFDSLVKLMNRRIVTSYPNPDRPEGKRGRPKILFALVGK